MDKVELLLKELTEANGVSGYEDEIRRLMARELEPLSDEIKYDKMGSIMGVMKGSADSPRVMIMAHMDEVGFMVSEITKEGYIKFLPLGGWWGHVALGQRLQVMTSKGPVIGVVGSKPPHLLPIEERKKVIEITDMFLDVGVQEKFDIKKRLGIRVGDPIVPYSRFEIMANKKMYLSKAFDNRMACGVVIEVMRRLKRGKHPNTLLGCGSTQEEVGLRGAQTLAHLGDPDVCIVCDVGIGQDVPPDGFSKAEKLGGGPGVLVMDGSMIPNTHLKELVIKTAETKNIPFHLTSMNRGGTDGGRVHISGIGVPSIVIGAPVRYIHSHNGILNRSDYDNTIKLITEVIRKLDKKTVKSFTEA
ncbi:MAG: M42 family metallopeptidase [candidate division Zixibacteria bacterium]|nr:M42 family metallopeptidase [candidate division Zixibacteria bacterium]